MDQAQIISSVKNTLGCSCPDEVFLPGIHLTE